MMVRVRVCPQRQRKHASEQRMDAAEQLATSSLRRHVTLPSEVEAAADPQSILDIADQLPLVSCAFHGCPWRAELGQAIPDHEQRASESPWDLFLRDHVLQVHGAHIQHVTDVSADEIWDVYKQALAVKERETIPAVGAAIDRRAFECTVQRYNDHSTKALVCFSCARICLDTGGARSSIELLEGGWLLTLPAGSLVKNFSKSEFERRYQQPGSPLSHRGHGHLIPYFLTGRSSGTQT